MSNNVVWVQSQDEFDEIVNDNSQVVVDFTAPSWCRPCQAFAPHFGKAAEQSGATFVAVDVDNHPWAMEEYGVQGVPTVKYFVDGKYASDLKGRTVVKLLKELSV